MAVRLASAGMSGYLCRHCPIYHGRLCRQCTKGQIPVQNTGILAEIRYLSREQLFHLEAYLPLRLYMILNGRNIRYSIHMMRNSMIMSMNLLNLSIISPAWYGRIVA